MAMGRIQRDHILVEGSVRWGVDLCGDGRNIWRKRQMTRNEMIMELAQKIYIGLRVHRGETSNEFCYEEALSSAKHFVDESGKRQYAFWDQ